MSDLKQSNYLKLKQLISENKILLLPHNKFGRIRQSYVYARCGMSLKYFEKVYNKGNVILQFGESGLRVGYPVLWEDALQDYLKGNV